MSAAARPGHQRTAVLLFQAVSIGPETGKPLIVRAKLPAVSLFQRFGEGLAANFYRGPATNQNSRGAYPQNRETAKQPPIHLGISMFCLFRTRLKQPETVKQPPETAPSKGRACA